MKTKITTLLLLLSLTLGFAQQYPPINDGSLKVEAKADSITDAYDRELSMTAKQKALFKLKVEDYLLRKQNIESKYEGRKQLTALVELQAQETLDMNDILTRIQMQVYKKIKPEIQPLKIVKP
ncbi:hypothetical protein [Psychroserpens mesophilus]|uniref:hypothetical protein n=1 Tax=Psychroserpens mesophilus TaxID=325473 RepID=UPI00058DC7BD|nr:hypothetical protein [Psychroserpens mesophilus]